MFAANFMNDPTKRMSFKSQRPALGIESYKDAIDHLFSLQRFGIKLGLDNMKRMLQAFGNPHQKLKAVHIAGSNGKGSVAAFAANIFQQAGYRVGLYTSPHLSDFSERIRINGEPITTDDIVQLTRFVRATQRQVAEEDGTVDNDDSVINMTFFEFTTLMALLYFFQKSVDLTIVEVGMGGRLDATNVLQPLVSVITNVATEHQQYLGNTLDKIAGEKAGILKPNGILITGISQPRVIAKIRSRSQAMKNKLYRVGKDIQTTEKKQGAFDYDGIFSSYKTVEIGMIGRYQMINGAMAIGIIEMLNILGYPVEEKAIREGLKNTRWPGRLEIANQNPIVLLDGAHNLEAIKTLKEELKTNFSYEKLFLVIGIMEDKPIKAMLKQLLPLTHHVIFTRPSLKRAASPLSLLQAGKKAIRTGEIVEDVKTAVQKAISLAKRNDLVCVTGSLFTAGEAREFFYPQVKI